MTVTEEQVTSPPVPPQRRMQIAPSARRPRGMLGRLWASSPWYLMVLPALILIGWLIAYPFVESVLLSFQHVSVGTGSTWIGFDNFSRLFEDPEMYSSVGNTIALAFVSTAIEVVIAWVLAILLWDRYRRISTALRVTLAIPMLLSPVVVGVVWSVLLNPQYGWIPALLHNHSLALLSNSATAMPTLIGVEIWQWTPFVFLIVAAALNGLSDDIVEAARMDGASNWRLFWTIVWPLTLPATLVAVLFRTLDALKAFDLPFNLTAGGPGTATETISMYLYRQGFTRFDQGYASALSIVATVIMAAVAGLVLLLIRRAERRSS